MSKSLFFLFALSIGLILAQTNSARSTPDKKSAAADSNSNSSTNSDTATENEEESSDSEDAGEESEAAPTKDSSPNPNSNESKSTPDADSKNATPSKSDSDNESDSSEQNDSNDEEKLDTVDKNPAMTCALFGEPGCAAECRLRAILYGSYGEGTCTESQTCQCDAKLVSFYQHWIKRFKGDYTYRAIYGEDEIRYEKVMEIFRNPLRTGKQFKELLKPLLGSYEYSKLIVADRTLAAKFTGDGEPDKEAIRKYIDENFKSLLESSAEPLLTANYKVNFEKILKDNDNKGTLYNITAKLGQLQNEKLSEIFEKYLKERNLEKPEIKEQRKQDLDQVFEDVFVNYIVEKNDQGKSAPKKSPKKSISAKKSTQEKRSKAAKKPF